MLCSTFLPPTPLPLLLFLTLYIDLQLDAFHVRPVRRFLGFWLSFVGTFAFATSYRTTPVVPEQYNINCGLGLRFTLSSTLYFIIEHFVFPPLNSSTASSLQHTPMSELNWRLYNPGSTTPRTLLESVTPFQHQNFDFHSQRQGWRVSGTPSMPSQCSIK